MPPVITNALRKLFMLVCVCLAGVSFGAENLQLYVPDTVRPSTLMAEKILTQAFKNMDVKVSFIPLPGLRMQAMWSEGKLDGIAGRALSTELQNGIKVDVAIAYDEAVVYTVSKKFVPNGYDSLKLYRVGYIGGLPYFDEHLKNITMRETAPTLESLFKKLEIGRSDLVVESRFSACLLKKLGMQNIVILEPPLENRPIYLYLHTRHQHLVPELEVILKTMEEDGSIKKFQEQAIAQYHQQCPL